MARHKTEAIWRRYAIVNDADFHTADDKLAALSERAMGTVTAFRSREGREAVVK